MKPPALISRHPAGSILPGGPPPALFFGRARQTFTYWSRLPRSPPRLAFFVLLPNRTWLALTGGFFIFLILQSLYVLYSNEDLASNPEGVYLALLNPPVNSSKVDSHLFGSLGDG